MNSYIKMFLLCVGAFFAVNKAVAAATQMISPTQLALEEAHKIIDALPDHEINKKFVIFCRVYGALLLPTDTCDLSWGPFKYFFFYAMISKLFL